MLINLGFNGLLLLFLPVTPAVSRHRVLNISVPSAPGVWSLLNKTEWQCLDVGFNSTMKPFTSKLIFLLLEFLLEFFLICNSDAEQLSVPGAFSSPFNAFIS